MASHNAMEILSEGAPRMNRRIGTPPAAEDAGSRAVKCRCPKCGKTHSLKFFWTGNGIPRKYCHRCREAISGINDAFICNMDTDSAYDACRRTATE